MIDARFESIIKKTLAHEGGFSDDENDRGGATYCGITLRFINALPKLFLFKLDLPQVLTVDDLKKLTQEQIKYIYYSQFWIMFHYDKLINDSIAEKMFDLSVNMGSFRINKIAQTAYNLDHSLKLVVDGQVGQASIKAFNECNSNKLLTEIKQGAINYYENIVKKNPSQNKFLNGWKARALS